MYNQNNSVLAGKVEDYYGSVLTSYAGLAGLPENGWTAGTISPASSNLILTLDVSPDGGQYRFDYEVASQSILLSPVPIPASVWILGSGLVGLLGLTRKFM